MIDALFSQTFKETKNFKIVFNALPEHDLDLSWLQHEYEYIEELEDGDDADYYDNWNELPYLEVTSSCSISEGIYTGAEAEQNYQYIKRDKEEMRKIYDGYYAVFCANVQLIHKLTGMVLANEYLGQCIYDTYEDFMEDREYLEDMTYTVIEKGRKEFAEMQKSLAQTKLRA